MCFSHIYQLHILNFISLFLLIRVSLLFNTILVSIVYLEIPFIKTSYHIETNKFAMLKLRVNEIKQLFKI